MQCQTQATPVLANVTTPVELVNHNRCGSCGKNFTGGSSVCTSNDTD